MTSPVSIPVGHVLLAADFDAYENLTGVWQSYTPAWTSSGTAPSLGNGTLTGAYFQAGKLVHVRTVLTMGSTTTFGTGTYRLSLPVGAKGDSLIDALCNDVSASLRWAGSAWIILQTAGGDNMRIIVAAGVGGVTEAAPFTWANGDRLVLAGSYEAA